MCYPLCEMVHIKDPFSVIKERVTCVVVAAGFHSHYLWSFTIFPTPYNRKYNVLSASLNKTFPSIFAGGFHAVQTKVC